MATKMKTSIERLHNGETHKPESKSKVLQWMLIVVPVLALAFAAWCFGTRQPNPAVDGMSAQIRTLAAEVEEQKDQIESLTAENENKENKISTLTTQITEKDTRGTVLTEDIVDKTKQIETLRANVAEKAAQIETLTASIAEKETQIASLTAAGKNKDQQIEMLTAEVAASAQQVETLKAEKSQLTTTLLDLRAEIAEKQTLSPGCKAGQYVMFGTYPQTSSGTDQTPIEWLVLTREGNKALLISRYALDCKLYNEGYTRVTWETCNLRKWLNNDFVNAAFTPAQQVGIETVTVDNSQAQGNSEWSTKGGNNTQDKVFLLSYAEANKYFANDEARECIQTAYAVKNGAFQSSGNNCCGWWLRSPGSSSASAAGVHYGGWLGDDYFASSGDISVRPALWIDLESGIF